MSKPARPWWSLRRPSGAAFWLAAFLIFAGFVVPLIHANRFRRQIQSALERALGRRVEIGEITLRLLPAPGFQMQNVVVAEDPAFGAEHFAYMTSMQARLRLRTLWTGQVQLASLILQEPSVNLVKNPAGQWNFETLVERAGAGAGGYFPYIGIDDGRVNFKFGDQKSLFHVQAVEAAISPPRDAGGRWVLRFAGQPARTDQVLSGMGRVRGQGSLTPGPRPAMNLELALDETPITYLLRLVQGRDYGVHGTLGARLRLSGETRRVQLQGLLEVGDFHRWDLMPGQESRAEIPLRGEWNLPGQRLLLQTATARPIRAELLLEHYLGRTAWRGAVELDGAPLQPALQVARHFGAALPEGLEVKGALEGRLEFTGAPQPEGLLRVRDGQVKAPAAPAVQVGPAEIRISGPGFTLEPVAVRVGSETLEAAAAGEWQPFRVEAALTARRARLEGLRPVSFAALSGGAWEGRLTYRKDPGQPGAWSGAGLLLGARWRPAGLASDVEIERARIRWDPRGLQIDALSGAVGATRFTGSCRTAAGDSHCRLRVPDLDLSELDRWLNPQQAASRWAVWKRALGLDSAQRGAWLRTASVQGLLQVDRLQAGRWTFRQVRSDLAWKDGTLLLTALRAELARGAVTGALKVEFAGSVPRYSVQAAAKAVDLRSLADAGALPANFDRGLADVRLGLQAAGRTAAELRSSLRAQGVFAGRAIQLEDVAIESETGDPGAVEIRSLEGQFQWSLAGLQLSKLKMTLGKDVWEGRGSIGGQQAVALEMASGPRQWRLVAQAP